MEKLRGVEGYEVLESTTPNKTQILQAFNSEGSVVAFHIIALNSLSNIEKFLINRNAPIHIYPLYVSSLDSYMPKNGVGLALWIQSEETFYRKQKYPYLRLIQDRSFDRKTKEFTHWTERKLPLVLEELNSQGINTEILWQGDMGEETQSWLILFE